MNQLRRLVAVAVIAALLASVPVASAQAAAAPRTMASYGQCVQWGAQLKDLKKRIDALQRRIDGETSAKKVKVLKKNLKALQKQYDNLRYKMIKGCS